MAMGGDSPTGLARLKPAIKVSIEHNGSGGDGEPDEDDKPPKWDDYELKSHAETLAKAEEIKKQPDLMKALKPHLDKKVGALKGLAKLKMQASMVPKAK